MRGGTLGVHGEFAANAAYPRNLVRVAEKLCEQGLETSYSGLTAFCRRNGIGVAPKKRVGRYDFAPGEEMQHDTSPHKPIIGGRRTVVQLASLVLCYSRRMYAQAYERWSRFECRVFLTEAIEVLGGSANRCMLDNASVIIARGKGKNAVAADAMLALARRFGFVFEAHEVGDADRSARVERPFLDVERNFYAGRTFETLADLNVQLRQWCERRADKHRRELGATPRQLWVAERPVLNPLPLHTPEVYEVHTRRADVSPGVSSGAGRTGAHPLRPSAYKVKVESKRGKLDALEQPEFEDLRFLRSARWGREPRARHHRAMNATRLPSPTRDRARATLAVDIHPWTRERVPMIHPTHRHALAAALGLGALGLASEASAAYVCQIDLFVPEEVTGSGSISQPMSFEVRLHDQPFCGGTQVGQPLRVRNQQFPVLNTSKVYDTVLINAIAEYEDTAVLGAFLQLHSAAAVGIPVEVQSTGEAAITLRYEGVSISQVQGGPPSPATGSGASTFEGYACRTRTQVEGSPGATYAWGHELQLSLSTYPDCKGPTVHQRTLSPRTQSALPDPKKTGASATLSYEQARRQEFNLATVALGHAMMMAQAGKMLVQVFENPHSHALESVRFRAKPHSTCPIAKPTPAAASKPKPAPKPKPTTKPALPHDIGQPTKTKSSGE